MALEQVAYFPQSTLTAGIGTSDVTLTVASASAFPSSGNFRILIDNELLLVTGVSGTTFTVTRNIEGTSPAGHSNGATVTHIVTAAGLTQFRADGQPLTGSLIANRPASAPTGQLFIPTDSPVVSQYNGSSWVDVQCDGMNIRSPVDSSSFSWVNQDTATVSTAKGGMLLTRPVTTSNSVAVREVSFTNTQTVTACLAITGPNTAIYTSSIWFAGLSLRRPGSDSKLALFGFGSANQWFYEAWTNPTTFSSVVGSGSMNVVAQQPTGYFWLRRTDDGTNAHYWISPNGIQFMRIVDATNTNGLSGVPTTVGVFAHNFGVAGYDDVNLHLVSWQVA
jgi:hypothetical protein